MRVEDENIIIDSLLFKTTLKSKIDNLDTCIELIKDVLGYLIEMGNKECIQESVVYRSSTEKIIEEATNLETYILELSSQLDDEYTELERVTQ